MSSTRLSRPLTRLAERQYFSLRQVNRPTFAPAFSTRASTTLAQFTPSYNAKNELQRPSTSLFSASKAKAETKMTHLQSAMPQLIPFFFVNETVVNFGAIVLLTYFMTKYALPAKLRTYLARLFISKL